MQAASTVGSCLVGKWASRPRMKNSGLSLNYTSPVDTVHTVYCVKPLSWFCLFVSSFAPDYYDWGQPSNSSPAQAGTLQQDSTLDPDKASQG